MRFGQSALVIAVLCLFVPWTTAAGAQTLYSVGVAKIDITPSYPVRLWGYAARKTESDGIEQHIWAKALAVGDRDQLALLVTVDSGAVQAELIDQLSARLQKSAGVPRERLVVCSSHTHCAPGLSSSVANMFGKPLPADQMARIDRYTGELLDDLEKVCLAAIADRKPSHLAWAQGSAAFAANRRTKGGPVEHVMPMLSVTAPDGTLRAVVVDYACHGTTLDSAFNKICGDWIGYAQQYIEQRHPGAVAMVMLGCAGDANPSPRGTLQLAQAHGREIAGEVDRLLQKPAVPLDQPLEIAYKQIPVYYDPPPSRQQWEELAKRTDAVGSNARIQLAVLNSGKALPATFPYPIETWTFGNQLAMVYLADEVVVDYDLRLKMDFDPKRLWVAAYSNDVHCYIPSKRILKEGGYEAQDSLTYYARPARLSPGTENDILRTVRQLLPPGFRSAKSLDDFPLPASPPDAVKTFRTRSGLKVELVASEPLIQSPVAIDWGPDGKLWVVEMCDYPTGMHENGTVGGRIVVLESSRHDGHYDKSTVFLDHLRMPDGIMAWGKGVLICAAPDVLYAEDTKHTGKADVVKRLFTGFGPENKQWLVNGPTLGLDNWVYGASSLGNGPIQVVSNGATIDLGNRDFRMHPDTGELEPAAGRTQYCRVRDDWGDWFGNDNSNLLWHYPLPEQYLRRNPYVTSPHSMVLVPSGYDVNQLYPASRIMTRFNEPQSAGRTTSACGPCIYRDDLLGPEFSGNAFICEPVHDMVMRLILTRRGATFTGRRAEDNQHSEFLASTDNWCRPVQTRTGPDGALWVVDMYRFVIEHPEWIPPDRLAVLDLRAGADMGRIYRIYPKDKSPRPVPNLVDQSTPQLAALLESPNGTLRDMIQLELVRRQDPAAIAVLEQLAAGAKLPVCRMQALWALDGLHASKPQLVAAALADSDPGVRRNALRIAEQFLASSSAVADAALKLTHDPDDLVRYQLALSLGEWNDPRAASALGDLAVANLNDPFFRAAVLSSAAPHATALLSRVLGGAPDGANRTAIVGQLVATLGATGSNKDLGQMLRTIAPAEGKDVAPWQFVALTGALDALDRRQIKLSQFDSSPDADVRDAASRCRRIFAAARTAAPNNSVSQSVRISAIQLLGRGAEADPADLVALGKLLSAQNPPDIMAAALKALARSPGSDVAQMLLAQWRAASPTLRSGIQETLLTRPAWTTSLLDALEKEKVQPGEITASVRARLLAQGDVAMRDRARALLSAARPSTRRQVLEQYKPALALHGDYDRGHAIFSRTCTACHLLHGEGHAVGADLTALTDRSPQALMIDILDPNAAVDGRYVDYIVQLKDGRTLSGIIADETSGALTILQPNGLRDTILRKDVQRIASTSLSLMPEGLESGMSQQDLADLIAFVGTASRSGTGTKQGNSAVK